MENPTFLRYSSFAVLFLIAGCGSSAPKPNTVGSMKGDWTSACQDNGSGGGTRTVLSIAGDGTASSTDKDYANKDCTGESRNSDFTTMKFSIDAQPKTDEYEIRITDVRETNPDPNGGKTVDIEATVTIVSDQEFKLVSTGGHYIAPGSTEVTEAKSNPSSTTQAPEVFTRVRL